MKRTLVTFVKDNRFTEQFNKIMGEQRTSIAQHFPTHEGDPRMIAELNICEGNTMARVTGRNKEIILPDEQSERRMSIVGATEFLMMCDLCVKANIMSHD